MDSISILDLTALRERADETTTNSQQQQALMARELVHALQTLGCARLVNHGIDSSLLQKAFWASQDLFSLDENVKAKYAYQGHSSNRGYIGYGKESHGATSDGAGAREQTSESVFDRKETFDIGNEGEPGYQTPWPFQQTMLAYFDSMNRLQLQLLRLIAIGLDMDDHDYFVDRCKEQHCNLRLLHYPEEQATLGAIDTNGSGLLIRGAQHTDFGTLTLLVQDSVGGLRVETRAGDWIQIEPVADSIIVQVGDMMQRWTGDVLRAAPHQVVQPLTKAIHCPDDDGSGKGAITILDRYSIAFFCNANKNVTIESVDLPGYSQFKEYEPINSLDYLTQRLNETIVYKDKETK